VIYEAVKESFLSHKRRMKLDITFFRENRGFRKEIIIMGSTITYLRLMFLSYKISDVKYAELVEMLWRKQIFINLFRRN
jgi:hypothetical protein